MYFFNNLKGHEIDEIDSLVKKNKMQTHINKQHVFFSTGAVRTNTCMHLNVKSVGIE